MDPLLTVMILTGGKSTRFGSDKSQALLGETSLLDRLLTTLPDELDVVAVGPRIEKSARDVHFIQEDPVGGGPVAAIDSGLRLVSTEFAVIIATDMPFASQIVVDLVKRSSTLKEVVDALIPLDRQGVRQTLCALYRSDSLRRALTELGAVEGKSMRALTALLEVEEIELPPSLESNLLDIDTKEDMFRATSISEKIDLNKPMMGGEQ